MTKTNTWLIGISVATFLLDSVLGQLAGVSLTRWFGLSVLGFMNGLIYQILSYPLAPGGLMQVLFSGLIIWFLGNDLENLWGRASYLFILITASLIGGLIFLTFGLFIFSGPLAGVPLAGLAGISSTLCILYAILYPDRQFNFMLIFPMKAKYFCLLLIAITLYQGIFTPGGILAWGHLGVMFGGFIAFRMLMKPDVRGFLNFLSYKFSGQEKQKNQFAERIRKSNLRIIKGEKDSRDDDDDNQRPPKYWQ